jgi:hypothetical protein
MDFAAAVTLAQTLIDANGRDIVLSQLSGTPVDIDAPWEGAGTPTVAASSNAKACFLPATGSELGKLIGDASLLKRVEQVALLAGGGDNYESYHQITDDSMVWKIDWIRVLKPSTVTVLYAIGVKR